MADVKREIGIQAKAAQDLIRYLREELDDEEFKDEDLRATAVEGETSLYEALEAGLDRYHEIDALIVGIEDREQKLKARKDRLKHQQVTIKDHMLTAMISAELTTMELASATVTNKSKADSLVIHDEKRIPASYWVQPDPPEPRPNKKLLLEDLKAGRVIDGVALVKDQRALQVRNK